MPLPTDSRAAAPTRTAQRWLVATVAATVGALAVAALFGPPRGARPGPALAALLFVGYAMHVAASGWLVRLDGVRTYARSHRLRCVAVPALLLAGGATVVPLLGPRPLECCLEAFFAWQLFHYTKQNLGIASLASRSQGLGPLRGAERRCVLAAGVSGVVAFLARPSILDLHGVPDSAPLFRGAASGFLVAVVLGLVSVARRPSRERTWAFSACMLCTLGFTAPLYVVGSPFGAIGGMTIAHGLQYLILTSLLAAGAPSAGSRRSRLVSLGAVALLGGVVVTGLSHLSPPGATRALFGLYLGVFAAHFVVDAGLWRVRDPAARAFLTGALPDLLPAAMGSVRLVGVG